MNEAEVKERVKSWLAANDYELVRGEFGVEGGRLDFLGGGWPEQEYEIEVVGVECKGETHAGEVWRITNEQLGRYARCVPKLYFACSVARDEQREAFALLCQTAGVGFIGVGSGEPHVESPRRPVGWRLDWWRYMEEVRSRVALFLTFQDEFGRELMWGQDWCATRELPDRAQWNAFVDRAEGCCYLGVNVENAKRMLGGLDLSEMAKVLGGLPRETRCRVERQVYFGVGKRVSMPVLTGTASMLGVSDLEQVRGLCKDRAMSLWVGLPVWECRDAFGRALHRRRIEEAKDALRPLYSSMRG